MNLTLLSCTVALVAVVSCANLAIGDDLNVFVDSTKDTSKMVLIEGLPHPGWEQAQYNAEVKTKKVQTLNGYKFYVEPLKVKPNDATQLAKLLANTDLYGAFSGEKKCGGFHPDYAVETRAGGKVYRLLICFGCGEAKLFGAGTEMRFDLKSPSFGDLKKVLTTYRKNRPKVKRR